MLVFIISIIITSMVSHGPGALETGPVCVLRWSRGGYSQQGMGAFHTGVLRGVSPGWPAGSRTSARRLTFSPSRPAGAQTGGLTLVVVKIWDQAGEAHSRRQSGKACLPSAGVCPAPLTEQSADGSRALMGAERCLEQSAAWSRALLGAERCRHLLRSRALLGPPLVG
jgi:hypothetical protein